MKKSNLILFCIILCLLCTIILTISKNAKPHSENDCFLVMEKEKILQQKGNCKLRHAPCSTFKMIVCLVGIEEGIIIDEYTPEWTFKGGYFDKNHPNFVPMWTQPNTPSTWMKQSCTWYSQAIVQKIGAEKLKNYIRKFNYGNQDIYGSIAKSNPLTNCWFSGCLKISAEEQVQFLKKLIDEQLPVSKKAQKLTKKLMYEEELEDGWDLYAKKGTGYLLNDDGTRGRNKGWYIGWLQKAERIVIFAYYLENSDRDETAGESAKTLAKQELIRLIKEKVIS